MIFIFLLSWKMGMSLVMVKYHFFLVTLRPTQTHTFKSLIISFSELNTFSLNLSVCMLLWVRVYMYVSSKTYFLSTYKYEPNFTKPCYVISLAKIKTTIIKISINGKKNILVYKCYK